MASKTPTIRQIDWISIIPQLTVMGIIIFVWHSYNPNNAFLNGAITYLVISISLRNFIPKDHRKGMKKVKMNNYEEAINDFEKSYSFFKQNKWIDKYRYLVLLSSSRISYLEMALSNIAFCQGQIGKGEKAKEYYEKTLDEFPESEIAKAGLRLLNSMNKDE